MRVDNLNWHPVRLSLKRESSGVWRVSREGAVVGEVKRRGGVWSSVRGSLHVRGDGSTVLLKPPFSRKPFSSFRAAVLSVARLRHVTAGSDGPQDFGTVGMLRVCVSSCWHTVIFSGDERYVYEDFTIPDDMTDERQAILRQVLVEAERWKKASR